MSEAAHTVRGMKATRVCTRAARRAGEPPTWTRVIGVFDLETTGVDVDRGPRSSRRTSDCSTPRGAVILRPRLDRRPRHRHPDRRDRRARHHDRARASEGRPARRGRGARSSTRCARCWMPASRSSPTTPPYDFSLLKHEAVRHGIAPICAPVAGDRSARRRQGVRPVPSRQAHARGGRGALRRAARRRARGIGRRRRRRPRRAGARRAVRAWLPPTADELHTRQIAWARAQAASLTEYFISIGRLDPDDRLDGSWPIR